MSLSTALTRLPILAPARRWRHLRALQRDARGVGATVTARPGVIELTRSGHTIILAERHLRYAWDVLSDFDRYYNAVASRPYRKGYAVDYFAPRLQHLLPDGLAWWFSGLAESLPLLEQEYCYQYRPQPGDVVFDGGAYCGETALIFARLVGPTGRVLAFEPDPANYDLLCYNVRAHNLRNVTPLLCGLWSASTRLPFAADGNLGAHVAASGPQIEVVSLADAYRNLCLERLDYVKLDIEGAEVAVIGGAEDFLRTHPTRLAIANHVQSNGTQTHSQVEAVLRGCGYSVQSLRPLNQPAWSGVLTYAGPRP